MIITRSIVAGRITTTDYLKSAPPESRGAAIAPLTETSFRDEAASPASHRGEARKAGTSAQLYHL